MIKPRAIKLASNSVEALLQWKCHLKFLFLLYLPTLEKTLN